MFQKLSFRDYTSFTPLSIGGKQLKEENVHKHTKHNFLRRCMSTEANEVTRERDIYRGDIFGFAEDMYMSPFTLLPSSGLDAQTIAGLCEVCVEPRE